MTHLCPPCHATDSLEGEVRSVGGGDRIPPGGWPCRRRRPGADPGAGGTGERHVRGRAALGGTLGTQLLPVNLEEGALTPAKVGAGEQAVK